MLTPLITQERTQKLDLLAHLIRNLRQSLVIFGPSGIGKSTYLQLLKENADEFGPLLLIRATERLSFEQIQQDLFKELAQHVSGGRVESVEQLLPIFGKHNQSVVLLIDDAGQLVSGLIATLVQYATKFNNLRIVFALTQEDLGRKHKTDPEIDDCHYVEIPPLSLSQCGEYLQHLKSNSASPTSNSTITAAMVEQIYKKTKGVPGKVVEAMPGLTVARVAAASWIYIVVSALVVSVVVGYLLWRNIANVVTSDVPLQTNAAVTQTLEIPGQTKPLPSATPNASITNSTATGTVSNQPPHTTRPEIINSKPDYYSGFARVREADALDEFKDNGRNEEQSAQVKVEIITPEPPPKEVVIAASGSTTIQDATTHKSSFSEPELPIAQDSAAKLKNSLPAPETASAAPKISPKEPIVAAPPLLTSEKPQVSPPKLPKNENKPSVVREEPKRTPATDAPALENISANTREKLKIVAPQKPETLKASDPATTPSKLLVDEKIDLDAKKSSQEDALKKAVAKPDLTQVSKPTALPEPEKIAAETAPNLQSPAKSPAETPNLAKLGVVMKYKAETPKATEKVEKSVTATPPPVTEAKPAKPASSKYTLQLMTFAQPQSLQNFMNKYGSLGGGLRHYTVTRDGVERYVVVYGAYDSAAQADEAKQKLPAEFRQALARKM